MRKLILGLIGAMAFSTLAQAQSANWSGAYVGASGGFGWGNASQNDILSLVDHSYTLSGGVLGGGIGYDMQAGPWVFGALADYSWANINSSTATTTCGPLGCGAELRSFGTLRGRVGYAAGNWLPYVTGGLAFGNVSAYNNNIPASGSTTRTGWTVGLGVETMFTPNWSAKLEYLYADLGSADQYVIFGVPERVNVTANILRVGLNYRFNALTAPAPLVRKH